MPQEAQEGLDIPEIKANVTLTGSPIHNPAVNRFLEDNADIQLKSTSLTDLNREVEELMASRRRERERRGDAPKDQQLEPGKRGRDRPASSNN